MDGTFFWTAYEMISIIFALIKISKMILIKEKGYVMENPKQKIPLEISNQLFADLKQGHSIFIVPQRFDGIDEEKNKKRNYKVGFLFDVLSVIYPEFNSTQKYQIISDKYHFWFTYRQFRNIMSEYESDKNSYYVSS